jgi:XTP/dITP diphosphohydrolase
MKIVFATNNKHKLQEVQAFLGQKIELLTLADVKCIDELPENQRTIEGNSLEKAQYLYQKYGYDCFADDSGLEVEALNNAPGVDSAHYAGSHRSHADNIALLLKNMEGISDRKAQFKTVITLVLKGETHQFEGIIKGQIITELRGSNGFGYDPVFLPEGQTKTFAEMTLEEKIADDHRTRAVKKLMDFLNKT